MKRAAFGRMDATRDLPADDEMRHRLAAWHQRIALLLSEPSPIRERPPSSNVCNPCAPTRPGRPQQPQTLLGAASSHHGCHGSKRAAHYGEQLHRQGKGAALAFSTGQMVPSVGQQDLQACVHETAMPPPSHRVFRLLQMGHSTAEAVVRAGLTLVPYSLTGQSEAVAVGNVGVSGIPVELVGPTERQAALDRIRR